MRHSSKSGSSLVRTANRVRHGRAVPCRSSAGHSVAKPIRSPLLAVRSRFLISKGVSGVRWHGKCRNLDAAYCTHGQSYRKSRPQEQLPSADLFSKF